MKEFDKAVGYKSAKTEHERIIDIMLNLKTYKNLEYRSPGTCCCMVNWVSEKPQWQKASF